MRYSNLIEELRQITEDLESRWPEKTTDPNYPHTYIHQDDEVVDQLYNLVQKLRSREYPDE